MTGGQETAAAVRKTLRVDCSVDHAFHTFTEGIGSWWPLQTHSISVMDQGQAPPETAIVEPQAGGRLYERTHDGRECDWGSVLVWEPPSRLVIEWRVNPANPRTEVEVRFVPDGDGTRVELEHRGWERFAAGRGPVARSSYEEGWDTVLGAYAAGAGPKT